jgi:hypothetical protein
LEAGRRLPTTEVVKPSLLFAALLAIPMLAISSNGAAQPRVVEPLRPDAETGEVDVRVTGVPGAQLESRASAGSAWVAECRVPCEGSFPLTSEYRVTSVDGTTLTDSFRLRGVEGDTVVLEVKPKSAGRTTGGIALIVLGTALAVASIAATVALERSAQESLNCRRPSDSDADADHCRLSGFGVALARVGQFYTVAGALGGVLAVVGGAILVASPSRSIVQYTERPPAEAFVRRPTWTGPHLGVASRPTVFVPLTFTF